jgi:hypothetical protein
VIQSSGQEEGDPLQEARAYNDSILLMVATPYVVLGALGFMVYRGFKSAERRAQRASSPSEQPSPSAVQTDSDFQDHS